MSSQSQDEPGGAAAPFDVAIIGGGVNGCGIARDLSGRGQKVYLCEQGDLAQATSSASTKLFHGGLRYLEHYEFRLVREALIEREVLLRAMPHISWPMRFVLPHHSGLRPAWLLRLGLFLYDTLGGRKILPGTRTLDLSSDPTGAPLRDSFRKGFEYSDCWVEDSRLVALNAVDAARRGAVVETRTRCVEAVRDGALWRVTVEDVATRARRTLAARALVNAAGPWVEDVIRNRMRRNASDGVRLVRGSHIVVEKLYEHDRAYIFQNADNRIIFAIPYENDFTLIGTTDVDHKGSAADAVCTPEEKAYLTAAASEYFKAPITPDHVVWTYSGVRPLYDDGTENASAATRDYVLKIDDAAGEAPALNIFGGKITTYRKLAEAAVAKLRPYLTGLGEGWTHAAPMPGGDFAVDGVDALVDALLAAHPFLDRRHALRLVRAYGTDAARLLAGAETRDALGDWFGWDLTAREVDHLMDVEFAQTADDVLWRRTKLGLRFTGDEADALQAYMQERIARRSAAA